MTARPWPHARRQWRAALVLAIALVLAACTASQSGTQVLTPSHDPTTTPTGSSTASAASRSDAAVRAQPIPSSPSARTTLAGTPAGSNLSCPTGPPTTQSDATSAERTATSPEHTVTVDLDAPPTTGSGLCDDTATLQVRPGRPVSAESLSTLVQACAATFETFRQMEMARSDAVAQPIGLTLTITSDRPAYGRVDLYYLWYLQQDHTIIPATSFLGFWAQRDPGRDSGVHCQPASGSDTGIPFGSMVLGPTSPGTPIDWTAWYVTWPTPGTSATGDGHDLDPHDALLVPSVTLNDQMATMTFQDSPAVLRCTGFEDTTLANDAIAVDPSAALKRGCSTRK